MPGTTCSSAVPVTGGATGASSSSSAAASSSSSTPSWSVTRSSLSSCSMWLSGTGPPELTAWPAANAGTGAAAARTAQSADNRTRRESRTDHLGDRLEQLVDHVVRGDLLQRRLVREDQAVVEHRRGDLADLVEAD